MAKKTSDTLIYTIASGGQIDRLLVDEVGSSPVLNCTHASLTPCAVNGQLYLLGYSPAGQALQVYRFLGTRPGWRCSRQNPRLGLAGTSLKRS